jgi:hypothetical protein
MKTHTHSRGTTPRMRGGRSPGIGIFSLVQVVPTMHGPAAERSIGREAVAPTHEIVRLARVLLDDGQGVLERSGRKYLDPQMS